jgi:hypothetical protein
MPRAPIDLLFALLVMAFWLSPVDPAVAHHVLGRPAYSLNEDSNTPPAMQAEVQVGDYLVTYMVYPAFPRPKHPGRINLYASRIDDGTPYNGKVTFKARSDSWRSWFGIGGQAEKLGRQPPDDNVFRQGYLFDQAGDYIISAEFQADGELYVVDFPLRIGEPPPIGPMGIVVGVLIAVLVTVSVVQRRRAMTGKIRGARDAKDGT